MYVQCRILSFALISKTNKTLIIKVSERVGMTAWDSTNPSIKHGYLIKIDDNTFKLTRKGYEIGEKICASYDVENKRNDANKENIATTPRKRRRRLRSSAAILQDTTDSYQSPPPIKRRKTNDNNSTPRTPQSSFTKSRASISPRSHCIFAGYRMCIHQGLNNLFNLTEPILFDQQQFYLKLVVDDRESSTRTKHLDVMKCLQGDKDKILAKEIKLCCGDFTWILEKDDGTDTMMLPFIIERKTWNDLSQSFSDGRYRQQKKNMQQAAEIFGVHGIYLIEGSITKMERNKIKSCKQAPVSLEARDGFCVIRTYSKQETLTRLVNWTFMIRQWVQEKFGDKENKNGNVIVSLPEIKLDKFERRINEFKVVNKEKANEIFKNQLLQLGIQGLDGWIVGEIALIYPTLGCLIKAWNECVGDDEDEKDNAGSNDGWKCKCGHECDGKFTFCTKCGKKKCVKRTRKRKKKTMTREEKQKLLIHETVMLGNPESVDIKNDDDDIMDCLELLQCMDYLGESVSKKLSAAIWTAFNK